MQLAAFVFVATSRFTLCHVDQGCGCGGSSSPPQLLGAIIVFQGRQAVNGKRSLQIEEVEEEEAVGEEEEREDLPEAGPEVQVDESRQLAPAVQQVPAVQQATEVPRQEPTGCQGSGPVAVAAARPVAPAVEVRRGYTVVRCGGDLYPAGGGLRGVEGPKAGGADQVA